MTELLGIHINFQTQMSKDNTQLINHEIYISSEHIDSVTYKEIPNNLYLVDHAESIENLVITFKNSLIMVRDIDCLKLKGNRYINNSDSTISSYLTNDCLDINKSNFIYGDGEFMYRTYTELLSVDSVEHHLKVVHDQPNKKGYCLKQMDDNKLVFKRYSIFNNLIENIKKIYNKKS